MSKFNKMLSSTGKAVRGMPRGKKIYASLWGVTGVFLAALIGVLVGYNTTVGARDDSKGSWSVKENFTPHTELGFVDANGDKKFQQGEKITVDGVEVISVIPVNAAEISAANVTEAQFNDLNKLYYNATWVYKYNDYSNIKVTGDANHTATILKDTLQSVKEAKVVYKIEAPDFKNGADKSFAYAKIKDAKDATKFDYKPLNGYVTYSYGDWKDGDLTSEARSQQNTIASVGALFALAITGSIFTTAAVEYNARKKGGKK